MACSSCLLPLVGTVLRGVVSQRGFWEKALACSRGDGRVPATMRGLREVLRRSAAMYATLTVEPLAKRQ